MKELKANILHGGVKFGMRENAGRVSGLLFADDTSIQHWWLKVIVSCKDM